MAETELFNYGNTSTFYTRVQDKNIEWIAVNPSVFNAWSEAYKLLASAESLAPYKMPDVFNNANVIMTRYPLVKAASEYKTGGVTFGKPIVYGSKEKNLIVPESIKKESDVYWIELTVTFHFDTDEIKKFKTLTYSITAPKGIIALELIPLFLTKEKAIERIVSSPEIKIQYQDVAIEIGKFIEKTEFYKSLTPMIVAYGLCYGNNKRLDFGWEWWIQPREGCRS